MGNFSNVNIGACLKLPYPEKKRMNIQQSKRLLKDNNFRYLYEDVNGGGGLKMTAYFVEKSSDPCQKLVGKRLENFEHCKNVSLLFTKGSRLTGNSLLGTSSC